MRGKRDSTTAGNCGPKFLVLTFLIAIAPNLSTQAAELSRLYIPCKGTETFGSKHCNDMLPSCSQVIPGIIDRFDQIAKTKEDYFVDKRIDVDLISTKNKNQPVGSEHAATVCSPGRGNHLGGGVVKNHKNAFCGNYMTLSENGLRNDKTNSAEINFTYGQRLDNRTCQNSSIRSELLAGSLRITDPICKLIADDIDALLNRAKSQFVTALNAIGDVDTTKVCRQDRVDPDDNFDFRTFCQDQQNRNWEGDRMAALARGCTINKALSAIQAAFEKTVQCEVERRTANAWRAIATANPGAVSPLEAAVHQPVYTVCAQNGAKAGEDHLLASIPFVDVGKSKRHGIGAAAKCIKENLFPRWKTWSLAKFPAAGGCKYE